ncbi:MAG: hypothetical protein HYW15_01930 [Candidatus Giovannonibacteria bacterium]|nr:MAG: hypothetical protein HYW15_01930 [Candidatus Giovannonibacteria bacterium]
MQILEKLFGGGARVKLLRFFLLSPEKVFESKEAAKILRVSSSAASKETRFLLSVGFLKRASRTDAFIKPRRKVGVPTKASGKSYKIMKKRVKGVQLSQTFPYLSALRNLLVDASPASREKMLRFFKNKGKIKLLVLGGVFSNDFAADALDSSGRLDLLIAGELKRGAAERFIKKVEADVGKELNWTLMSAPEFERRLAMHDKLLRDLFDYQHEFLINKLGIE